MSEEDLINKKTVDHLKMLCDRSKRVLAYGVLVETHEGFIEQYTSGPSELIKSGNDYLNSDCVINARMLDVIVVDGELAELLKKPRGNRDYGYK